MPQPSRSKVKQAAAATGPTHAAPEPTSEWDELTPRERLSLALDVINRSEMTPEDKLRLESALLTGYEEGSAMFSSSLESLTTSDPSSSSPSSPDADYWEPSPDVKVRQEDWIHFVMETSQRFLVVLQYDLENLQQMASQMPPQGGHVLAMETQVAMVEMARIVTTRIHLAAVAASQPDLLVPDKTLLDAQGNPLKRHADA